MGLPPADGAGAGGAGSRTEAALAKQDESFDRAIAASSKVIATSTDGNAALEALRARPK